MTEPGNSYATAYKAVCDTYHAIDDFRAKLLGFLPVVSGVGALTLVLDDGVLKASPEVLVFAGVFGALITLGLFLYEVRGLRHCTFLIDQGREFEKKLNLEVMGQFWYWYDKNWKPAKGWTDFPGPARVIYTTVFAGWVFVASYPLSRVGSSRGWDVLPFVVGGVALGVAHLYARRLTAWATGKPTSESGRGVSMGTG